MSNWAQKEQASKPTKLGTKPTSTPTKGTSV